MVRVISTKDPLAGTLNEKESKDLLENKDLLIHIGTVDEKGEPFVTPTGFYFGKDLDKIYITTQKNSKKVENLRKRNSIYFCVDDPTPHTRDSEARPQSRLAKT